MSPPLPPENLFRCLEYGIYEIVVGSNNGKVAAYEWKNNRLSIKGGWPASTCSAGQCPEVRGLDAGDLNGDGRIEIEAHRATFAYGHSVGVRPKSREDEINILKRGLPVSAFEKLHKGMISI